MSVLIAYCLIGLINGIGLLLDRLGQDCYAFDPDSYTDWAAALVVLVFVTAAWPTLFTKANMNPETHHEH